MKTAATSLLLALLMSLPAFALETVFLDPIEAVSPALKAQGGTSTANAEGFDSLFANPAAFSVPKSEITFFLFETTSHVSLTGLNKVLNARDSWQDLTGDTMSNVVSSLLAGSGVGQELSSGGGWVGNNLGLGLLTQFRLVAQGKNLIKANATLEGNITGVIGMGWPFDVGLGVIRVGGAIRPMQHLESTVQAGDALANLGNLTSVLTNQPIASGFGLGLDVGMRWDYAGFQTGLVIKDFNAPRLDMKNYDVGELQKIWSLSSAGEAIDKNYQMPTVIGLGTAWTPDMGSLSSLFQPSLAVDLQIPLKDKFKQSSFWTWTHFGASAKLLKSVSIRTGLNQGYFTFGLGAKLLIVDFNLAIFAEEMGKTSGSGRRPGISTEFAFRL